MRTRMGWTTRERIVVRGRDLPTEILGKLTLGDMAFLELTGRTPTAAEGEVFNAIAVTLVEHGLTPSAIAARMTFIGAPEALQAAVGAGLCGLGSVFVGSTQSAAAMLLAALPKAAPDAPSRREEAELRATARTVIAALRARRETIPGIGHPLHKPVDPRTEPLFEIATRNGFGGDYIRLMRLISAEASAGSGRELPVNATGAIAAIACELGLTPRMCHGIAVMARAIGLVGHLVEEEEAPMTKDLWARLEAEAARYAQSGDAAAPASPAAAT